MRGFAVHERVCSRRNKANDALAAVGVSRLFYQHWQVDAVSLQSRIASVSGVDVGRQRY